MNEQEVSRLPEQEWCRLIGEQARVAGVPREYVLVLPQRLIDEGEREGVIVNGMFEGARVYPTVPPNNFERLYSAAVGGFKKLKSFLQTMFVSDDRRVHCDPNLVDDFRNGSRTGSYLRLRPFK